LRTHGDREAAYFVPDAALRSLDLLPLLDESGAVRR
jgi:hypothetical protein